MSAVKPDAGAWSTQLDGLLAQLETHARSDIDGVLVAASEEAARLRADADRRCDERRASALAKYDEDMAHTRHRAVAAARRNARAEVLAAQHALADRVVRAARELIVTRLRNAADTPEFRDRLNELLTYFEEPDCVTVNALGDGIRLTDGERRLEINDSVDAWLARERPRIAIDACRAAEVTTCQ